MARRFIVKDHDDQFITSGDDIEELIENLKEQEGLTDPEELIEDYEGL